MTEMADPTTERKFIADADYYRLGYQLTAQIMHREESDRKHEPRFKSALDIFYGERVQPRRDRPGPAGQAEVFIEDAETVLRWFRVRRKTKKWLVLPGKLTVREERLERFLQRTVIPCLTIVIAASLRRTDPQEAKERIEPLRQRALPTEKTGKRTISYRALYNLACYEAGEGEASKEGVLRYLAAALEQAPGSRRRELGKWARKDPSFSRFREDGAFQGLLKPYE